MHGYKRPIHCTEVCRKHAAALGDDFTQLQTLRGAMQARAEARLHVLLGRTDVPRLEQALVNPCTTDILLHNFLINCAHCGINAGHCAEAVEKLQASLALLQPDAPEYTRQPLERMLERAVRGDIIGHARISM